MRTIRAALKSIVLALAALVIVGCEGDDDGGDARPLGPESEPKMARDGSEQQRATPAGARACFPKDYQLPGDSSNSGSTRTTTIGNPGDPFYQVTTISSGLTERIYSDGSTFLETRDSREERTESLGVTNHMRSTEVRTRLALFDGSEIGQFSFEQYENGARVARQYLAAIECAGGQFALISKREFEQYRNAMGF